MGKRRLTAAAGPLVSSSLPMLQPVRRAAVCQRKRAAPFNMLVFFFLSSYP